MNLMGFGPGAFRLMLAMAVVVEHLSRLQIGKLAVMVFFMLSGYWVTRMYAEKYARTRNPLRNFYVSRSLRLWPAYAMAVVLAFLVLWAGLGIYQPEKWLSLLMFGVATHERDMLGISWSLDLEMQFYLILPLVCWILATRDSRLVIPGILAVAVAGWLLDIGTGIETVAGYLPLFAVGAILYLRDIRVAATGAAASLAAFVVFGAVMLLLPEMRPFVFGGIENVERSKIFALFWALPLVPFVAYNVRRRSSRLDRHAGNLSYSVYLIHFPLVLAAQGLAGGEFSSIGKLAFLALILPVSIAFYAVFDVNFEKMRRWVLRRMETGAPQAKVVSQG